MLSKKLNNRGYMIVEIIVASVIAFSVAYYLLNLTYKFKDKNEDVYFSTNMLTDKINITKNIMNDWEEKDVSIVSYDSFNVVLLVGEEHKKIEVGKNTITYGKVDGSGNFINGDNSYYRKKIDDFLEFGNVTININTITIPISNIYSDTTNNIKLFT